MKIIIIRHGDPDYSIDSLTERGRKEAELLKLRLDKMPIDAAYVSPLGRAALTAKIATAGRNVELVTKDWLREFVYIWDRLPEEYNAKKRLLDSPDWIKYVDNNDVEERYKQVCDGLDELLKNHGYVHNGFDYDVVSPNHDNVFLFCHYGVECVILSHLLGVSPYPFFQGFCALPTSVTTIASEERRKGKASFRCIGFGDLSHLYAGNMAPSFAARFSEAFDDGDRND